MEEGPGLLSDTDQGIKIYDMQNHIGTGSYPIAFSKAPIFLGLCDISNEFPDSALVKGAIKSLTEFSWICSDARDASAMPPGTFNILVIGR